MIGIVYDPNQTFNNPTTIAITPAGTTAYVTNDEGNTVSIIALLYLPAPTNVQGYALKNIFLTQIDLINLITWNAPSVTMPITAYTIYRDAALTNLIATIPATGPLQFLDHNRQPDTAYSYYIVAISSLGTSAAAVVTVTQP